jgi:WD40 repeat protein
LLSACSSRVTLRGVIGFAPDGEHVLIVGESRTLGSFALSSKTAGWSQSMPGPSDLVSSFVRFSNNGRFFVLYETTHAGGRTGRYSVWESATGRRTSPYFDMAGDMGTRDPGFVAVSDDGRWLASCLEMDGLRIYDAPKKALAYSSAEFSSSLRFAPRSMLLATGQRKMPLGQFGRCCGHLSALSNTSAFFSSNFS